MPNVKIVGIGGMGGRFVTRFNNGPFKNTCETVIFHTRKKELSKMAAERPVFIGEETFLDKGTKGDPLAGAGAAETSSKKIVESLVGSESVCLVAALGGGTGSGAAPVVARLAKTAGAKRVVALAVTPFRFEGPERARKAEEGLERLREAADTVLAFPNDLLCDEGHMRSLEIPHGWADRPSERFVLGNQMRGLEDRFFIAHERLAQAALLAMDPEGSAGEGRDFGPMKWLGMGASTVGERGLWESLARAIHWSVTGGGEISMISRWKVQLLMGEERPQAESSMAREHMESLLGRKTEVSISTKVAPALKQRLRLTLAGWS